MAVVAGAFVEGTKFGKYTLGRQLAVGGMAEIYLARVDGIGQFAKQVVLKRILAQHAKSEEFIEMFLHEARMAARLQHPNVVQVFDIGEIDGSYFFTMEYVKGEDLRAIMTAARKLGSRIPIDQVVAIISSAAAGLHYAHDAKDDDGSALDMVHRDVSPSNIMVSFDGSVKVTDFGIAKTSAQMVETRTGVLKGKISYMSPEQCQGEKLDRRSDVFALGIVLHELLTGQKLFRADNDYAIIKRIVEQDAPLASSIADRPVPDALDAIVTRALVRDREQRYASAQELQVALDTFAREQRLDVSSVTLSKYMRQLFPAPAAAPAAPEPDSQTPVTTPKPTPATNVTVLERNKSSSEPKSSSDQKSSSAIIGELQPRPRARSRWYAAAAAVGLLAGGVAVATFARTPSEHEAEPAPPPSVAPREAPAAEDASVTASALVDAAVVAEPDASLAAASAAGAPVDAGVKKHVGKTHATTKVIPDAGRDACQGWNAGSMSPPPPGCDLK